MKQSAFLLLSVFLGIQLLAQTDSSVSPESLIPERPHKKVPYFAKVKSIDGQITKGWLYMATDDKLMLVKSYGEANRAAKDSSFHPSSLYDVPMERIGTITTHRKNAQLKGTLIGLGVGVISGVIIGFASGDDPTYDGPINDPFTGLAVAMSEMFAMTAAEKAAAYGILLGAGGAITGLVISSVAKKKFIIGGKKQKGRDLEADLMKRLIVR